MPRARAPGQLFGALVGQIPGRRGRSRFRHSLLTLGFLTLAVLLIPSPSAQQSGQTRYVNTDPSCGGQSPCYTTIQAAVNAAQAGDTILIQAGTYQEQVSISGKNNVAGATEASRIVVEADPQAPLGGVVLQGTVAGCTNGHAVRFQQSKFITLRGLTITGAGGQAISLMGGNNQNQAIHLERLRIFGNGSGSCNGGITIARGNPGTLILNSLIYANGRNGITFIDADGGPHYLIGNTIHANQWDGVDVARDHEAWLVNNAVTGNGTATGSTGGRFGVSREASTTPHPATIHLLNNLLCGNRLGEINGPALDSTDANNLTPTGAEGPGFSASPGCDLPGAAYASVNGPDGLPNTGDDDFALAPTAPAIDRGMDPRTLGLDPAFNPLLEADFSGDGARPKDGDRNGTASFDMGALELTPPNRPPIANAGADRTVTSGTALNLAGSASSDPDGDTITFQWSQAAGPTVSLSNPTSATPGFTAPTVTAPTVLTFQLQVSDGHLSSTASVNITVNPPPNRPPVLDPIGNKTVNVGNTLAFTVSGNDLDGDPLTFSVSPQPLPANAAFDPGTRVFTFTPATNQVGSFSLTFSVSDGRGGVASETITITVTAVLQVTITSPTNGTTVPAGLLLVRGTVNAGGQEAEVTINGVVAAVQGPAFAVQVPVTPATTMLTATVMGSNGATASHSVAVSVFTSPSPVPALTPSPGGGVAPLTVQFTLGGITPSSITLDVDGDGLADFMGTSLQGQRFTYTQPGLFFPTATVSDGQGGQFTATTVVLVETPTVVTSRFQSLWSDFKARLVAGDIPGALAHLSPTIQSQFGQVFQALGSNLPTIAASLENLVVVEQLDDLAEAAIVRQEGGISFLHFIYFRRDSLGRWRIEEM